MSSHSRKRMLIVMPALMPESLGGAERQCQILIRELSLRGWGVTVMAPSCDRSQPATTQENGAQIERLFFRHYPNLGGRHILSLAGWTMRALFRIAKSRGDIDAIYVFHARLHVTPAVLAAGLFGTPLFIKLGRGGATFDFESLREKKFLYGKAVLGLVKRLTAGFVANSAEIAENLRAEGIGPDRILSIPNGVQMADQSLVDAAETRRTCCTFLYAGRLAPEKNVAALIQAFALAAEDFPEIRLRLAGDGPLMQELRQLAGRVDPGGEHIVFLRPVTAMAREYLDADFFISASGAEGQSNALLEAMGSGAAPVVYAASGASDMVQDGASGLLIPDPSPQAIAGAIRRAAGLGPQRALLARQARQRVLANSIGNVAQATSDAIQAVLEARAR